MDVERVNRRSSRPVEPNIEVDRTNVTVSYPGHSASPITLDSSRWPAPPAARLDDQTINPEKEFPRATEEKQNNLAHSAMGLLSSRTNNELVRVARLDAGDPLAADISAGSQKFAANYMKAYDEVKQSHESGQTAWLQDQRMQAKAARDKMMKESPYGRDLTAAAQSSSAAASGVKRDRSSSSPEAADKPAAKTAKPNPQQGPPVP